MKKTILLVSLLVSLSTKASFELQVGDVILQPLHCRLCTLIEEEERSIYSHIGVVLQTEPEVLVGEAFITVRALPLAEFAKKTQRNQAMKVLRFQNPDISRDILGQSEHFLALFRSEFAGKKYDADFLWNNFDEEGQEKLYCSEFVSKIFQALLGLEMPIKRMHFSQYREQWDVHFRGKTPVGLWGNSPADYERSELFYSVGEL